MVVLAIIGVIVGIVLLYFLIKLLFSTYILATVLSVGLSIASLVIAGKIIDVGVDSSRADSLQIATLICTTLAWSFFMGPIMFETSDELWITLRHWDEIKEFWTDIEFSWPKRAVFSPISPFPPSRSPLYISCSALSSPLFTTYCPPAF